MCGGQWGLCGKMCGGQWGLCGKMCGGQWGLCGKMCGGQWGLCGKVRYICRYLLPVINKFYLLCVIFSGSPDLTLQTCYLLTI
jgi:hypothetical protein